MSYINISGTFYYLCSILDGCSRYIVNWDLRESMTETDIEVILERARSVSEIKNVLRRINNLRGFYICELSVSC